MISISLLSQYVGVYSLAEDEKVQSFYLDYNGNINLGSIFDVGALPDWLACSNNGIVIVGNSGYAPPNYLTLSILKISNNGQVNKIRDVDLGGRSWDICITPNDKYALDMHRIELGDGNYDGGISVLEVTENDVITPPVYYLSLLDLGLGSISRISINSEGILIGISTTQAYVFSLSENGVLEYTGNFLNIGQGAKPDAKFTPDGNRCFISGVVDDLWVLDVDESNNVSVWGTVETELEGPRDIAITPNSRLVLQVMTSYPDGVAIYRNNEDGTIDVKGEITGILNPWAMAMTPDGKFATVIYNPSSYQSYMTVLKINGDETVERLPDKDVVIGPIANAVVLYKLPETSVKEIWEMYK